MPMHGNNTTAALTFEVDGIDGEHDQVVDDDNGEEGDEEDDDN